MFQYAVESEAFKQLGAMIALDSHKELYAVQPHVKSDENQGMQKLPCWRVAMSL